MCLDELNEEGVEFGIDFSSLDEISQSFDVGEKFTAEFVLLFLGEMIECFLWFWRGFTTFCHPSVTSVYAFVVRGDLIYVFGLFVFCIDLDELVTRQIDVGVAVWVLSLDWVGMLNVSQENGEGRSEKGLEEG